MANEATPTPPGRQEQVSDRGSPRLALVAAGLIIALVGGFGLGRISADAATPTGGGASTGGGAATASGHPHPPGTGPHDHSGPAVAAVGSTGVSGLSISAAGYRLVPVGAPTTAGRPGQFRFQVHDAQRRAVTTFAVKHEKRMHLVVVRRDLSGYQHLHPTMAADGTWSVPLTLPVPGVWRAYADFAALDASGRLTAVTLGVDLVVPGDYRPRALPADAKRASVNGIDVWYDGTPREGSSQPLYFWVARAGIPVEIEPYLGAYGHLVALREGDLGYVHVHPEAALSDGAVKFWLAAPSPGRYRLFFDFQVAATVRTAEFTLTVP